MKLYSFALTILLIKVQQQRSRQGTERKSKWLLQPTVDVMELEVLLRALNSTFSPAGLNRGEVQ
jgi:hypothetical protein